MNTNVLKASNRLAPWYYLKISALNVFLLCLRVLPKKAVTWLARALGLVAHIFARKERRKVFANLYQVYKLPARSRFAQSFCVQVGLHQIESFFEVIYESLCPGSIVFEGEDELNAQMHKIEGNNDNFLVATAHLGSWELVGYVCSRNTNRDFFALAKKARSPLANQVLAKLRSKLNLKIIWSDQSLAVRKMMSALSQKHWLGFVMDQKPQHGGHEVRFFNRKTQFLKTPAQLSVRYEAPVFIVFCTRLGPFRYKVDTLTLPAKKDALAMSQAIAEQFETMIKLYPEQWCWNYRRWHF